MRLQDFSRLVSVIIGLTLSAAYTLDATIVHAADINSPDTWQEGRQGLASLGNGYIVWESNRTGLWRIWKINLDGSGQRQLSLDEKDREHHCPHISPDGKKIAYLSYPKAWWEPGFPQDYKAPLHLMSSDGTGHRILASDARMAGSDRAVVWLNNQELMYIGGDRMTYRLDLNSGQSTPLLKEPAKGDLGGHGWLMNPTLTHATGGYPTFSVFDGKNQHIAMRQKQEGCMPYFSRDGVWGFWMGGGGGPVNRMNLTTGEIAPVVRKDDPSLPRERNYVYFPMLSPCGRLLAFGASPDQHDHSTSDYDIFVVRVDPKKLEMTGKPVRYTFDKACDRYPAVFLADMELGEHHGEAPITIKFSHDQLQGAWDWNFGDGTSLKAAVPQHTFAKAGEYEVEARQGERTLRGRVVVAPPAAPRPAAPSWKGERELVVRFDEPVQLKTPTLALESKTKIEKYQLSGDGLSLSVILPNRLPKADRLLLDGIYDKAQQPNKMPAARLAVAPLSWPSNRSGLVFLWQTGNKPNLIYDVASKTERTYTLRAYGQARVNRHYAMQLGSSGSFYAEGADENLVAACRQTNELTVEATILPANLTQSGPARIITSSSGPTARNFTLGQEGDKLILRLRTPQTGESGTNPQSELCTLSLTEPDHIVVTYAPGKLVCYRNGQEVFKSDKVQGDFSNWTAQQLLLGDEWGGERVWAGQVEGVAIYNRVLAANEARSNYEQYKGLRAARKPVPRLEVQAKLVGRSKIPTLKDIQPYRQALVVYEYQIEKVLGGHYDGKTLRVAHWALLDGTPLPIAQAKDGTSTHLTLEPFKDNKQLESIYLSDTLEENFDLDLYFDVNP